ncbi:hypothetical protein [Spongiactinospora sp. TRM90649]|uniref:hypothetical protein n=1 Tax=Spongiactinospora sp. TRM90649 TaxID=3031114 RepID=UPI0023F9DC23|nr:hypothetical protein [Spongiactinospora sp. TRM90649]MDF5755733.1 hypothetical protein [Spongiactinospora sp. TRM90649]
MRLSIRIGVLAGCLTLAAQTSTAVAAQAAEEIAIDLPDTGVKLHEDAADPVLVRTFTIKDDVYLRPKDSDDFVKKAGYTEITVAPGGALAAGLRDKYSKAGYDQVIIIDQGGGAAKPIRTVKRPYITASLFWSRDGRQILGTTQRKVGKKWVTSGFTLVDVAGRTSRLVQVPNLKQDTVFEWAPDARGVIAVYDKKIREYDLKGKLRRTLDIGTTVSGDDVYSPSGKRLLTWCPSRYREDVCVSDRVSGKIVKRVAWDPEYLWGWWDETHFVGVVKKGRAYQSVVADLTGRTTRVLADITANAWKKDDVYLSYSRR